MAYKVDGTYNTVCPRDCFGVCSLRVGVESGKVVKISGNSNNGNSDGNICIKGASYAKRLYHPERLKYPLLRDKTTNGFSRISWDAALELISNKLTKYKEEHGSESIMYLSGWGHTGVFNDYSNSFWSQFGTVTSAYGSLCMAAGKTGVKYTYGNTVKHNNNGDLQNAKLIIVWGSNPANTNIHRMRNIKKAVKNGAKLIVIDPRVSETMVDGAIRIHPRGGTDALLAMGVAKLLIERNICDYDFISKHVLGFEEYKERLSSYSMEEISEKTEVSVDKLTEIVDEIEKSPTYALISGTGKSRYSNGGQTERCVSVLTALTGSIGVSGGGYYFSDNQQPDLRWTNQPKDKFEMDCKIHVGSIAHEIGSQTPKIKAMWIEKTNPLTSLPNVNILKAAMKDIDFIVVVEHFMTDTSYAADLVLPAAMFAEKNDLISVYGDSYIHLLQKIVEPYGECKSEPEIYRLLGAKLGLDLEYLPIVNEDTINKLLKDNNIKTDYEELSKKPYLTKEYRGIAYDDFVFDTPSGKIEIYSEQMKGWNEDPLPSYNEITEGRYSSPELYKKYPIHFLSAHAFERINSQFVEMQLSKKNDIPKLQMNTDDARQRNISNGDLVRVFNDRGEIDVICEVGNIIKVGTAHIYEGWSEKSNASANKLTKGFKTDIGNGTVFHDCLAEIIKL